MWNGLVTEDVALTDSKATGPLSHDERDQIKRQTIDRLAAKNPILKHIMEVKIVQNQRRNFINISVRKDYLPLIFMKTVPSDAALVASGAVTTYCFFLSDKLEPFVIITAVHHIEGKVNRLTTRQYDEMCEAVSEFKQKFHISNEGYHYTPLQEREHTDSFTASGAIPRANKAHSTHFHLKMRIATAMLTHLMPVCALLNLEELKTTVEPIRYQYSRDTVQWAEVAEQMRADTIPA